MLHKDALKLLNPLELGDTSAADTALEGSVLDTAQTHGDNLSQEMFADITTELLPDWERVCGFNPRTDDPLQLRRAMVLRKLRELGDIKPPYFVSLAADLGYDITIEQMTPFMCGWNRCGDQLYASDVWWIWKVSVSGAAEYYFRAGQSTAGERLSWFQSATALELIFNDLKPADVWLWFVYP